jgi:hypothetical protein
MVAPGDDLDSSRPLSERRIVAASRPHDNLSDGVDAARSPAESFLVANELHRHNENGDSGRKARIAVGERRPVESSLGRARRQSL